MEMVHLRKVANFFEFNFCRVSPQVREFGFRNPIIFCIEKVESGTILLVESRILGFGIPKTAQGIANPINATDPMTKVLSSSPSILASKMWRWTHHGMGWPPLKKLTKGIAHLSD